MQVNEMIRVAGQYDYTLTLLLLPETEWQGARHDDEEPEEDTYDRFIRNGINGFHGDSVAELADHIGFLLAHPGLAWKIGQASRETAIAAFHIDRFLADWRRLIRDMLGHSAI